MTIRAWRICKRKYARNAFTGEGAERNSGRWNGDGVKMVYTSSTISLASLELLVNLESSTLLKNYALFSVDIELSFCERVEEKNLPSEWRNNPAPLSTQKIGDGWIARSTSVALIVPSVVVPIEQNILLNPAHPNFSKLIISRPMAYMPDPRLKW